MEGPFLDEDNAAFVQRGVSIVAASRDAALVPSIARATGCVVSSDRRQVTIFAIASQSLQLLADVRESRRIAVVFSQPTTHRTLQLKADDARIRSLREDERAVLARYVDAFATEIGKLGHTGAQAHIMFECRDEDVVAIDFRPNAAFEQTPGPKAGSPLAVTR
jgi:hypothetical protein